MFFVIIYSAIDQGYIGLSLASCHKDEIWDLWAELGLIWDHFKALAPIGTKSQIWDIITSTVLVIWIFSFLIPNFFEIKFSKTETLKKLAKVSKPKCKSLVTRWVVIFISVKKLLIGLDLLCICNDGHIDRMGGYVVVNGHMEQAGGWVVA